MIRTLVVADGAHVAGAQVEDLVADLGRAETEGAEAFAAVAGQWGLTGLDGARNNRVYRWLTAADAVQCVKVYKVDDRRRLEREWNALTVLAHRGVPGVPRPLWCAEGPPVPIMGMTFLPGSPVGELTDPRPALAALPELARRIQESPVGPFRHLPRIHSAEHCVNRINRVWPEQLLRHPQDDLTTEMRDVLRWWRRIDDASVTCQWAPRIFSRGDANLLNWLWDGTDIRVVDFEFCGYSDRVFDAAEMVEHISARIVDDAVWDDVVARLGLTPADRPRYLAARRTCAVRWLAVLWKHREKRPDDFRRQRERVAALRRLPS